MTLEQEMARASLRDACRQTIDSIDDHNEKHLHWFIAYVERAIDQLKRSGQVEEVAVRS